jgi:butyryl-CoA dehydrogenase
MIHQMRHTVAEALREECLRNEAGRLTEGLEALNSATQRLLGCGDPELRLANATIYLDAFGHVVIGWMWLRQAIVASRKLTVGDMSGEDRIFYEGKIMACQYFTRHELPLARARLALCGSLDTTCLEAPAGIFGN